jgi:(p)ppGpp synthase/HD superfamily hydrolase
MHEDEYTLPHDIAYAGIVIKAMKFAIKCHEDVNQKYDGKPYSFHLRKAEQYGVKYSYLLKISEQATALAGLWVHDVIEDTGKTYNNVKEVCGEPVAEIAYALTNEKGRTRKERANAAYYRGIRNTPLATYDKLCDRLANASYSIEKGSRMAMMYAKENEEFITNLSDSFIYRNIPFLRRFIKNPISKYMPMVEELEQLFVPYQAYIPKTSK